MFLFAEDGKAVSPARSVADHSVVQLVLDEICAWSLRNGQPRSMVKCVCLHFGSKKQGADYVIHGHQLLKVSENCANLDVIRSSDFFL